MKLLKFLFISNSPLFLSTATVKRERFWSIANTFSTTLTVTGEQPLALLVLCHCSAFVSVPRNLIGLWNDVWWKRLPSTSSFPSIPELVWDFGINTLLSSGEQHIPINWLFGLVEKKAPSNFQFRGLAFGKHLQFWKPNWTEWGLRQVSFFGVLWCSWKYSYAASKNLSHSYQEENTVGSNCYQFCNKSSPKYNKQRRVITWKFLDPTAFLNLNPGFLSTKHA